MTPKPIAAATALTPAQSAAVVKPGAKADYASARAAGEEFEAFFIAQMLEHMFNGIKADHPFGGGQGEETYRSLLTQEYGKVVTRNGGIGIADAVAREILKLQEVGKP